MTKPFKKILLVIILLMSFNWAFSQSYLKWGQLPALPNSGGLAGAFAGTSNGALLVAGGSNFPKGEAPWTGGKKAWFKTIWVLERPAGIWKAEGELRNGMAYGASIS